LSRGLGNLQRNICETLNDAAGMELPVRELRRRLGEPDRSNLRRGIRGLLERGYVEELSSEQGRWVRLTFWGVLFTHHLPDGNKRLSTHAKLKERLRKLEGAREERRRRLELEAATGPRWVGYRHRFVRHRFPGPTQERILSVLWKYSFPLDEGLPVAAVKAIVGGDRSNTRRAIKALLLRGHLYESEDGERIRLSTTSIARCYIVPPIPKVPVDDENAKEILRMQLGVDLVPRS